MLTQDSAIIRFYSELVWCSKAINMKKITIVCLLLVFATASFCQQDDPKTTVTHIDLLKKSKQQKTFAWVLAGVSTISFGKALIDFADEDLFSEEYVHSYGLSVGVGLASLAGSVVLFVASGRNKRKAKAASAFLNMEKFPVLQGTSFINQSFPVIGVKIKI